LQKLQAEFEENGTIVETLNDQTRSLTRSEGEADNRQLRQLVSGVELIRSIHRQAHAKEMFAALNARFDEFKRPRDFEHRVGRLRRLLDDVQTGVTALTPASVNVADSQQQMERGQVRILCVAPQQNCT